MKTSVVMATYNGVDYLLEQLDSLRDQSLQIEELIICDDCSKDETVSMIREYIEKNGLGKRWRLIENEKNLGYANNFHKAMSLANGEYIFFADQDDIWCSNKIEEMVRVMEGNPKIQLLCSDYEPFSSAENAPTVPKKIMEKMTGDGSVEEIVLNSRNIHIASLGCDMCIRKSFRDRIEPFWISGWAHDDYVWKMAQCVGGCFTYHKPLIKRRLHANNVSMRKMHQKDKRVKFLRDLAEAYTGMLNFAKSINMEKKKVKFIEKSLKATNLRADLVEQCKLMNSVKLLGYLDCYHSVKSVLVEPYMALKYRKQ